MIHDPKRAIVNVIPVITMMRLMSGSILKKKLSTGFFCKGNETRRKRYIKKRRENP